MRPDRLAQHHQRALDRVDAAHRLLLGVGEDQILELLQLVAELFENREVGVDHGVDQGIRQVVGT